MIETILTPAFQEEIVDFLVDRIENFEDTTSYGCDLVHELTLDENNNGAWVIYIDRANDFVNQFREDAERCIEYYRSDFGADFIDKKLEIGEYGEPWEVFADEYEYDEDGDIISEPEFDDIDLIIANNKSELLTFFMLYYGVNQVVPYLPCVEESWNDEIEIDRAFIGRFLSELKGK